jgi:hypothetical protein
VVVAELCSVPDEEKSLNAADTQPAVEVKHQEEVPSTEDQLSAAVKEVNITDSAVAAADEKKEPSPAEVVETETHTQCMFEFNLDTQCYSVFAVRGRSWRVVNFIGVDLMMKLCIHKVTATS